MNDGMRQRGHGSRNDDAETPDWLFKALEAEFGFDFDAAANLDNAKCTSWTNDVQVWFTTVSAHAYRPSLRIFCNPPYSNIDMFVDIALRTPYLWVFLLPAFVDKLWYRKLWESGRRELRPFRHRILFERDGKPITGKDGKPQGPFFGSLIVVIRPINP